MTSNDRPVRTLRLEYELPGTPEQIWQALATGPGNATWFVPADIDGRAGGDLVFHLGEGMDSPGSIRVWEPPSRLVYDETQWTDRPGFAPLVTEYTVEARAGGSCVVRVVTNAFAAGDDWDQEFVDEFFAYMEQGWAPYFENLRLYLTHFRGQPVANVHASVALDGSGDGPWRRLLGALGLDGAKVGDTGTPAPDAPALAGTVEHVSGQDLLLRLDRPAPGTGLLYAYAIDEGQVLAGFRGYLFGDDAPAVAEREQQAWSTWLAALPLTG